ncbi:ATP-binding protein [Bordetella genomosp. 9]|uniref:ATP-binding protein n=1 Tax=Bordetella genomosp. 9 TaxID=1416803 RepID=UPI001177B1A9|nr:ATP-binding protein [Bordetella genomosp. 9]
MIPDRSIPIVLAALGVLLTLFAVGMLLWNQRRMRIVRHTAEKARAEAILARERAEAADSAKSAFLATVSHEIRTPMNGVIGVLDILQDTPLSVEQQRYLGTAMQSARLLLRVLNDTLDYAKIESGALPLCNAPYDFYRAMENMAELYLPLARRKGLTLTVAIMPHFDRRLVGDEIRVSQVVANLLSNAIAFTDRGAVTLSARRRLTHGGGDEMEIVVRDTGAGMSEEYQRRLFSPFQQEDTSTTRRHGGTGLGLSIVKHLVERMGGTITIRSRRGHGTSACVRIPAHWNTQAFTWPAYPTRSASLQVTHPAMAPMLRAWCRKSRIQILGCGQPADIRVLTDGGDGFWVATATRRMGPMHSVYPFLRTLETLWSPIRGRAPTADPAHGGFPDQHGVDHVVDLQAADETRPARDARPVAPEKPAPETPADVLLVEDNEINRDITVRQLALLGVTSHSAEDGEAGYAAWLMQRPRVMLVDCHMPRLDGYELARRIRTHEMINAWPRTTLIGFSANATQSDARACLAAGMDDYVPKPTTRAKLREALQRTGYLPAPATASDD